MSESIVLSERTVVADSGAHARRGGRASGIGVRWPTFIPDHGLLDNRLLHIPRGDQMHRFGGLSKNPHHVACLICLVP